MGVLKQYSMPSMFTKQLDLGIILHAALPMDMMFQRLMEDVQWNFLTT